MRLTFGVPYMVRYFAAVTDRRLSLAVVLMPTRVACVLVSRWSVRGRKWSQPTLLAGGVCRPASELDCLSRGVPVPSDAYWRAVRDDLREIHAAIGLTGDGVDVVWGWSHTLNMEGAQWQ